jgi:hypothetical protein
MFTVKVLEIIDLRDISWFPIACRQAGEHKCSCFCVDSEMIVRRMGIIIGKILGFILKGWIVAWAKGPGLQRFRFWCLQKD